MHNMKTDPPISVETLVAAYDAFDSWDMEKVASATCYLGWMLLDGRLDNVKIVEPIKVDAATWAHVMLKQMEMRMNEIVRVEAIVEQARRHVE